MITNFKKFENKQSVSELTKELVDYMLYLIDEKKHKYFLPDTGKIIVLLNRGADKNAHDPSNNYGSLLSMATYINSLEIVKIFVERNVDLDSKNSVGSTSIYTAAYFGYLNILKYLHKSGANINIPNNSNTSPLSTAISKNGDCAYFLLKNGAEIDSLKSRKIFRKDYKFQKLFIELYPYDFIDIFDDKYIDSKIKDEYDYLWDAKNFNL